MNNPFIPSEIASLPEDFFGRDDEIRLLARSINQGSVCIEGSFGIGKSSFMSRTILHMDGFSSNENNIILMAVGHSDINSVDDAARLILDKLVSVDAAEKKLKIGISNLISYESTEAYSFFNEGRHLSTLTRIVADQSFKAQINGAEKFIIAIDECEKCAPAIATLMRTLCTEVQHQGIKNLRFVLAGVSSFYQDMANTDRGVTRFIYKCFHLEPLDKDSSEYLLDEKFKQLILSDEQEGRRLEINPEVINRIAAMSGGHPHLLQLLGSHVVEHEFEDPDGCIDLNDLVGSLREICYESRGRDYDLLIHTMKNESYFSDYCQFISLARGKFPSRVDRDIACANMDSDAIQWLLSRNIISQDGESAYSVVDEFLRIRVILDQLESNAESLESEIIEVGEYSLPGNFYDMMYSNTSGLDNSE